jgi:hypothetical protein
MASIVQLDAPKRGQAMLNLLWTAALLLVVLWMLGFALHFMGGLIHLLLVLAAIAILVRVVLGRKPA